MRALCTRILYHMSQCGPVSEWASECWMHDVWRMAQSTKPVSLQKYLRCTNSKWNDSNDIHGFKEILSWFSRFLGVLCTLFCISLLLSQSEYFLIVGFVSFITYLMLSNDLKLHKSNNWTSQLYSFFLIFSFHGWKIHKCRRFLAYFWLIKLVDTFSKWSKFKSRMQCNFLFEFRILKRKNKMNFVIRSFVWYWCDKIRRNQWLSSLIH